MRTRARYCLIASSLLAAACASGRASAPGPARASSSDSSAGQTSKAAKPRDLDVLTSWLEGRYDNYRQVVIEQDEKLAKEIVHAHVHAIYLPVSLPALGERVLFEQQYRDGDPAAITRQRLYAFTVDPGSQAITSRIYELRDPRGFSDPSPDPKKLAGLKHSDLQPLTGCELKWKRHEHYFDAATIADTCRITGKDGTPLAYEETMRVYADGLWLNSNGKDKTGKKVIGHQYNIPVQLRRTRVFTGWAAIKSGGEAEYITSRDVLIHDQGEKIPLLNEGGKPTGYMLKLTEGIYAKAKAPVLKLALYKEGKEEALGYVWANPDVERIGLNVGDIQVAIQK
jgi:hypothetical protein